MEQGLHVQPAKRPETIARFNLTHRMAQLALKTLLRYHNLPKSLIISIMSFLYSSPFTFPCESYVLVSGECNYKLRRQAKMGRQASIQTNYTIKEGEEFLVGSKSIYCSNVKISKIWKMPETKTQKKIIAHAQLLKSFFKGDHLKQNKKKVLNRSFLIPVDQIARFQNAVVNINNWAVNLCSHQIIKDYVYLIMRNYIQIELKQQGLSSYLVIVEGYAGPFVNDVCCVKTAQGWRFDGNKEMTWKKTKRFSRKAKFVLLQNQDTYLVQDETCTQIWMKNDDQKNNNNESIVYEIQ